jgi:SRSO17 transposase
MSHGLLDCREIVVMGVDAVAVGSWGESFGAFKARIAGAFGRRELRETAGLFLDGLVSGIERKTGWLMAERAGLARPHRIQALLGRTSWDAEALRDIVRDHVIESLGTDDPVLVVDETGFLKKGTRSVGVARQYSGTAGRIENSQVGVFVSWSTDRGHALVDRQLYLPRVWADDSERRAAASVPEDIAFATKPAMARMMVERTLDAVASCAWVLADAVYGSDFSFRRMLQERCQPYVLAVRSNQMLRFLEDATPQQPFGRALVQTDPATLANGLAPEAWYTVTAGEGTKGARLYEWARIDLPWTMPEGFEHCVLIRRSRVDPEDRAYFFVFAPEHTSLPAMARAAGHRWTIEECFARAKGDLGLDHCEARSWHAWHRHMTLMMAAAAFLADLTADARVAEEAADSLPPSGKANETRPLPTKAH